MSVSRHTRRLLVFALAVVCLALYVGFALAFDLGSPWMFLGARQLRAFMPALVLFCLGGDVLLQLRVARPQENHLPKAVAQPLPVAARVDVPQDQPPAERQPLVVRARPVASTLPPPRKTHDFSSFKPGEELYVRARSMPHQLIPNYGTDGLYLDMLGDSAALGYAPAMQKLGEYAMRRAAWVEAYYWMWRARQCGAQNLAGVMRDIRKAWIRAGCPDELQNVYELFSEETGSIGRALIGIDTGRNAETARKFLKEHLPDFPESAKTEVST